jgi:cation:H+ antiporter
LTTLIYFKFLGALGLLLFSSEILVRSSLRLARRFNFSDAIVGLVIIGFGTSVAELSASIQAVLHGSPAISIGNIVGSNTANILLILGIGALICPLPAEPRDRSLHVLVFLFAGLVLCGLYLYGLLIPAAGIGLLLLLGMYLILAFRRDHASSKPQLVTLSALATAGIVGSVALGLVGSIFGAEWLVKSALTISQHYGIAESIFGLTIVAVGTSLPELAATVSAAWRGKSDLVFGNIIGSNIFNILGITGFVGLFGALDLRQAVAPRDIIAMGVATLVGAVVMRWGGINRMGGGLMVLGYVAYVLLMSRQL